METLDKTISIILGKCGSKSMRVIRDYPYVINVANRLVNKGKIEDTRELIYSLNKGTKKYVEMYRKAERALMRECGKKRKSYKA
ncbi:hypothetical protein ACFLZ7_03375 [Nanoarchaeota archaeon]